MIWLDIIDPKYVLFFKSLIPQLQALDSVLITTRQSEGYDECLRLLGLFGVEHYCVGGYGGASRLGKFESRLNRQKGFLELFEKLGEVPRLLIVGASVDGVQCAYGLGIPIVHFADTPVAGQRFSLESLTILARLTLPLSSLVFRPFVVPEICYTSLGLHPHQVIAYDFIDVALWLGHVGAHCGVGSVERGAFCQRFGLDPALPIVLVREEEYKAHYVKEQLAVIYESVRALVQSMRVNVLCMPRYGKERLESLIAQLPSEARARARVLDSVLMPEEFFPYIDVLLGGGGTMNLEACYLGIPVVSTRSLLLFHDRFVIDHGLMKHAKSADEVLMYIAQALSGASYTRADSLFAPNGADFSPILAQIAALLESKHQ